MIFSPELVRIYTLTGANFFGAAFFGAAFLGAAFLGAAFFAGAFFFGAAGFLAVGMGPPVALKVSITGCCARWFDTG